MEYNTIINSLLDTDLYKFTMMYAIYSKGYHNLRCKFKFIDRKDRIEFSNEMLEELNYQIDQVSKLKFSEEELKYLKDYFSKHINNKYYNSYLSFINELKNLKLNSENVKISVIDSKLDIEVEGNWMNITLWEIILMCLVSEIYFKYTKNTDNKPNFELFRSNLEYKKGVIEDNNINVIEFGTRRRYSKYAQEIVLDSLKNYLSGTSNLKFAIDKKMSPKGTFAHEYIQLYTYLFGFEYANSKALLDWSDNYITNTIGLTDTYTTDLFLNNFETNGLALHYNGVRHDSGDPYKFIDKMVYFYNKNEIDPLSKKIIFSDGLTVNEAVAINNYCKDKIVPVFGIGTSLTNDVGVNPLNIVVKLIEVEGFPIIKLSDVAEKHLGNKDIIEAVKTIIQYRKFKYE